MKMNEIEKKQKMYDSFSNHAIGYGSGFISAITLSFNSDEAILIIVLITILSLIFFWKAAKYKSLLKQKFYEEYKEELQEEENENEEVTYLANRRIKEEEDE